MKITINKSTFELEKDKGAFYLNGDELDIDIHQKGTQNYLVTKDGMSYDIQVISVNEGEGEVELMVGEKVLQVNVKDDLDVILEKMGGNSGDKSRKLEIKAPMPGVILDISVREGQSIEKGDALLILEAMKMENVIKSSHAGVVSSVFVEKGDVVEKGKILLIF